MNTTDRVRIGIIGAGGIVRHRHLPNLRKIPGVQAVAVANRSEASGRRVAVEWDIPFVHADWREVVQRRDVDAVLVGTWPYLHAPVTLAALEAGKHVFCQARLAMDLAEARRMNEAADRSGRVTMVCPPPHGLKGDRLMRRLVASDFLGAVRLIRLTSLQGAYADPAAPLHWRQDARFSGRNVLTLGIYAEVIHRWFGYARRVSATMQTFVTERRDGESHERRAVTIPDSVTVAAQMESGAELSMVLSGVIRHHPHDTLEVFGEHGALIYNFADDTICGCRNREGWKEIPVPPGEERPWTAEQDFVSAIRGGPAPRPDFEDGCKYMEFVEAAWRSHERRLHVDLPIRV